MKSFHLPGPYQMGGGVLSPFFLQQRMKAFIFQNEFSTPRPIGTLNGVDGMTVIDTENCLSVIPNFSTSLANQVGVTFGGANNACIYTGDTSCVDYPTGFDASAHKSLGRIFLQYDANERASWCYLGGQGGTATACLAYRDAALTIHGWNVPTAFVTDGAAYTFNIYQPTSGGKLFFMGGSITSYLSPIIETTIDRKVGQVIAFKITPITNFEFLFGAKTGALTSASENSFYILGGILRTYFSNIYISAIANIILTEAHTVTVILRSSGCYVYIKNLNGIYRYVWSSDVGNTSILSAFLLATSKSVFFVDWIRLPQRKMLFPPVISDAFTAADSTSNDNRTADGLGHAETTGLGSGGLAVWHSPTGAVQSNRLVITPTGGIETQIAVNENALASPDVEITAIIYRTAADPSAIIFGLDSKSTPLNYGKVYFDGAGNIKTDIITAGTPATIATVAVTFVDGYALRVWEAVNETTGFREVHVFYSSNLIGAFMTLTAPQTAATNGLYAGLFSTADTNSFDSCVIRDVWTGTTLDGIIGL